MCESVEGKPDGQGRALMVRIEARWGDKTGVGRSSLVEPGAIAGYRVGMMTARTVKLDSLQMTDYTQRIYALPRAILAVGGFAYGLQSNGSYFPLVVAVRR